MTLMMLLSVNLIITTLKRKNWPKPHNYALERKTCCKKFEKLKISQTGNKRFFCAPYLYEFMEPNLLFVIFKTLQENRTQRYFHLALPLNSLHSHKT